MPRQLLTRWGRALNPEAVLQEHPRPQLVRESYLNLNGTWEHAFTSPEAPAPTSYDGPILVPFSPEAPLSGVGRQLQPDERLWYRRSFEVPPGFVPPDGRLLLHFGAVDQTCTVWVDDVEVGSNEGGYLPFSCDLTVAVSGQQGRVVAGGAGPHTLVVAVRDLSDGQQHASGKQRLARGGIWYTAQSGIWQTVWLEAVPAVYVESLTLTPYLDPGRDGAGVEVTVQAGTIPATTPPTARLTLAGRTTDVPVGATTRVPVEQPRLWSPADPHLYDVELTLGEGDRKDRVTSYVGLRTVTVAPDPDGVPRLLLNGEPFFHAGVLDQGYWPDGLLTAPSDEAMVADITSMKQLGFTMLRKHLKIEPLRWYAHCDRLGMLVWQDAVNGGGRYRTAAVTWPGRLPIWLDDTRRRAWLGRADAGGRALFRTELRRTVEHLRGLTSVVVWVPFNEGWGQFEAATIAAELQAMDPTRPVDHASGWHDQGAGHVRSLHVYSRRFDPPPPGTGDRRVLALTEYGGHSLTVPGHVYDEQVDVGYGREPDPAALLAWFTALHDEQLVPAVGRGLAASVYTQLSDVEDELNGLLTYDREVSKLPVEAVRLVLERLRLGPRGDTGR